MITLLTGDNSFEIERTLDKTMVSFDGSVERIDGEFLQINQLPDLLMGVSLFASKRLVVIRDLSLNKSVWPVFGNWIDKVSDDILVILVDSKPDKRSVTYKKLKTKVNIQEFSNWSDRDVFKAEKWVIDECMVRNISIDKSCVRFLVQWVGIDQWQLFHAVEKLSLMDSISIELIKELIDANPNENVFNLLTDALDGNIKSIHRTIQAFKQSEDVYKLLGLLSSQVFQMAAITYAGPDDDAQKDFAINPYVVSKLRPIAKRLGKIKIAKLVSLFADADIELKTSASDPWVVIENTLIKSANLLR